MYQFRLDTATDGRQKKKKHSVRQQLYCVDRYRPSELFCCCVDVIVIAFIHVVVGMVTPSKGEGWNEFPIVLVSFLDDGVHLFRVTIIRR